jgi:hypothetical protein
MELNIISIILGTVLIVVFAIAATFTGTYIYLLTLQPCSHCRTMISKKATTCPHCGKGVALAA